MKAIVHNVLLKYASLPVPADCYALIFAYLLLSFLTDHFQFFSLDCITYNLTSATGCNACNIFSTCFCLW